MLGVALLMVVTVALGLVVWKSGALGDDHNSGGSSGAVDRTVGLLREKDPVCDEWGKYADELAEKEQNWDALNKGVPAAKWTSGQREIFESVGLAMLTAADQFESILHKARNVVVQELIAQTIVYLRAYVERIPNYVEADALLAGVAGNFSNALTFMCKAAPRLSSEGTDDRAWVSTVAAPETLSNFMAKRDSVCADFVALVDRQSSMLAGWTAGDPSIPAERWSSQERALNTGAREVLAADLVRLRAIADRAKGRTIGDLIATQNAYLKGFIEVIPIYIPTDIKLWRAAIALAGAVSAACEARL